MDQPNFLISNQLFRDIIEGLREPRSTSSPDSGVETTSKSLMTPQLTFRPHNEQVDHWRDFVISMDADAVTRPLDRRCTLETETETVAKC